MVNFERVTSAVLLLCALLFVGALHVVDSHKTRPDKQAIELRRAAEWGSEILKSPLQTCASMLDVRWREAIGKGQPRSMLEKLVADDRWISARLYCKSKKNNP